MLTMIQRAYLFTMSSWSLTAMPPIHRPHRSDGNPSASSCLANCRKISLVCRASSLYIQRNMHTQLWKVLSGWQVSYTSFNKIRHPSIKLTQCNKKKFWKPKSALDVLYNVFLDTDCTYYYNTWHISVSMKDDNKHIDKKRWRKTHRRTNDETVRAFIARKWQTFFLLEAEHDDRQHKHHRLAGAGECNADHITTRQTATEINQQTYILICATSIADLLTTLT